MSKLTKVTLEYDDGTIRTLTGDDAASWMTDIDNMCIFMKARNNSNPFDKHHYDWKEEKI